MWLSNHSYFDKRFKDPPTDITFVDITPAARWYYESPQEYWDYKQDFPIVALPWPLTWMEFQWPAYMAINETSRAFPRSMRKLRVGCMAISQEIEKAKRLESLAMDPAALFFEYCGQKLDPMEMRKRAAKCAEYVSKGVGIRWFASLQIFIEQRRHEPRLLLAQIYYLDEDGSVLPELTASNIPLPSTETLGPLSAKQWGQAAITYSHPFLLGISLMHCRNVATVEERVAPQLLKKRKKMGLPTIRFRTLQIDPFKAKVKAETAGEKPESAIKRALHICRGHFKDYREKGLFGKYKGIYWWGMQARGSSDAGEVIKDYVVGKEE